MTQIVRCKPHQIEDREALGEFVRIFKTVIASGPPKEGAIKRMWMTRHLYKVEIDGDLKWEGSHLTDAISAYNKL